MKPTLRIHPHPWRSVLLAFLPSVVLILLASAVWAAGPSAPVRQAAPRLGDTASPSLRTVTPTSGPTDLATHIVPTGTKQNPGKAPVSTPGSSSFLPDKILGIPTTFVALGMLAILVILAFVITFMLLVRARRRRDARGQSAPGPVSTRLIEQDRLLSPLHPPLSAAPPSGPQGIERQLQLRPGATPSPQPSALQETTKLRQEDASAQVPQQAPRLPHPLDHITPPVTPRLAGPLPARAPAERPLVPAPPTASTGGIIFCPECGLQQQISSDPCPRCGFDLNGALTRVHGSAPNAPEAHPVPPRSARAPTPPDALLPFTIIPADQQRLDQENVLKPGPLSGQVLGGKYQLDALLGRGGVGVVYKASNQLLKRPQAIKVLLEHYLDDAKFRERFLREAQVLAALDHPNILPVHDFGVEEERAYLVMPFIRGGTLQQWLKRQAGPLALEQTRRAGQHIAAALDYAHAQGVVHLDLKPANILLHPDGRLLLSDFGLAHLMEEGAVEGGTSLQFGTPSYMAPEHIQGEPGLASDIYALGIILYQLLTGQLPFQGSNPRAILHRQATEPPPPLRITRPDLPVGLEGVLGKALAKEPAARYPTAGALLLAFHQAISS